MAMTLVSTVTVGSGGAASIEFTSIPQTGKDLLLVVSARTNFGSNNGDTIAVRFNGDSANNYTFRNLRGDGSATTSVTTAFSGMYVLVNPSVYTSNTFGNASLYVSNYTSSSAKSGSSDSVTENNATTSWQVLAANSWSGTAAISSLSMHGSQDFLQHSTASLYLVS